MSEVDKKYFDGLSAKEWNQRHDLELKSKGAEPRIYKGIVEKRKDKFIVWISGKEYTVEGKFTDGQLLAVEYIPGSGQAKEVKS